MYRTNSPPVMIPEKKESVLLVSIKLFGPTLLRWFFVIGFFVAFCYYLSYLAANNQVESDRRAEAARVLDVERRAACWARGGWVADDSEGTWTCLPRNN